ncbi:uncharacterized protein LOC114521938 [Dendronephthya gigantea]|uniref:uncharacterized protein LOC114521938 n=1 Tax=Dendronephthya gigantea TaxID=151771 RepID=UPI00106AA3F7|nr:uncharacterized protein LOC114521938 [Dendronephthya gigantea]
MSSSDVDYNKMEEEFAYSMGIQACIFGLPLKIFERLRKVRLDPDLMQKQEGLSPVAPINQIGHLDGLATPDKIPYTPNNDTVYSSALVELIDEPIILKTPSQILDRYWSIQVADAYLENRFYIGSRTTDGYGGNVAFVGPNFVGDLPDVVVHRLPYNSAILALRFAVDKNNLEEDTKKIQELQKQFSLTSLSNWNSGKLGVANIPASVKPKPNYDGDLKDFQLIAALMMDNPPTEKHAAQWEAFHNIGLVPGQEFQPEKLSKPTYCGLKRAAEIVPKLMQWKVKFHGTSYETRWNKVQEGTYEFKYLDRAAGALAGLLVHDYEECVYYCTCESYVPNTTGGQCGTGEFFNSSSKYTMHFNKNQLPVTKAYGFWSITMTNEKFNLVANEINRYSINLQTKGIEINDDGSLDLYFQAEPPENVKERNNWLPCPKTPNTLFHLTYRIYLPTYRVLHPDNAVQYIPPVMKRE